MINKYNFKYYKRILTFDLPVLYSPNEPVHFLGIFTSWIRIREAFLNADPYPQHCLEVNFSSFKFQFSPSPFDHTTGIYSLLEKVALPYVPVPSSNLAYYSNLFKFELDRFRILPRYHVGHLFANIKCFVLKKNMLYYFEDVVASGAQIDN